MLIFWQIITNFPNSFIFIRDTVIFAAMYRIKLNEFEGPLDLLLFFIQRDELDIYNIPISKITRDFMEYIQYIQELDLK